MTPGEPPSRAERLAQGRALRKAVPRSAHGAWTAPAERPDPLALIAATERGRLPELIPLRRARMCASPSRFFRGTAELMAMDLARTPATGVIVQAAGDAHLGNFGTYATAERRQVFDVNDFDETHPAPWEWDVKRLAVSAALGAFHAGGDRVAAREAAQAAAAGYRAAMRELVRHDTLARWYLRTDARELEHLALAPRTRAAVSSGERAARRVPPTLYKGSLVERRGGAWRIRLEPPLVTRPDDAGHYLADVAAALEGYRDTLTPERRRLLDGFRLVDAAWKVVGVGSVGLRCGIALLVDRDDAPLVLQWKEARPSVLSLALGQSEAGHEGERIVRGQRLLQAASDPFLGWGDFGGAPFYVRQLRDRKFVPDLDEFRPADVAPYVALCGRALARAHARLADPAPIAGYLGRGERWDEAVGAFALAYAKQVEQDFEAFVARFGAEPGAPGD